MLCARKRRIVAKERKNAQNICLENNCYRLYFLRNTFCSQNARGRSDSFLFAVARSNQLHIVRDNEPVLLLTKWPQFKRGHGFLLRHAAVVCEVCMYCNKQVVAMGDTLRNNDSGKYATITMGNTLRNNNNGNYAFAAMTKGNAQQ